MTAQLRRFEIAMTTPGEVGTAISNAVSGLARFDLITIDADLEGATDGDLDVYLQREIAPGEWRDWAHFPQLGSGAPAASYTLLGNPTDSGIIEVGTGDDDTASPALAADSCVGGHPGNALRVVCVAGEGTTAGADITIRITGWMRRA